MEAVQADDPLAFEELMTRNQTRVRAFLLRLVGNAPLAEDLAQEVFMRVYKHRATYRREAKFSTWLYRVAHNVACNALRSKSRRPETLFGAAARDGDDQSSGFESSVTERTSASPTRQIARLETQQIVRAAVDSLSPRQREAVMLARFQGLSYQEIADVMEMTPQAVKSLLCRARINLKEALAPYVNEGKRPS